MSIFRYEGDEVNMTLAKSEAKLLHQKIAEKAYNDEDLIRILSTRSKAQLTATLNQYNNEFGNAINKVLTFWLFMTHFYVFNLTSALCLSTYCST